MKTNKLFRHFWACSFLAAMLVSCDTQEPVQSEPSIEVEDSIDVDFEGGEYTLSYNISNPVDGVDIVPSCEESWVELSVTDSEILINVALNETAQERTAVVDLFYTDECSASFDIIQAAADPLFVISVDEENSTYSTLDVSVETWNADLDYFVNILPKFEYDKYSSETEVFQWLIGYITGLASEEGQTFEEYVSSNGLLYNGNLDSKVFENLSPLTEYCVIVVASNTDGEKLSDVYVKQAATADIEMLDIVFDFDFVIDGVDVTMSVEPSDDEQYYYFDITTQDELDSNGQTIDEMIAEFIDEQIESAEMNGMSIESMIKTTCAKGFGLKKYELVPNIECIGYAVALNLDAKVISEVSTETFQTEQVAPSDNSITLNVHYVGMDRALLEVQTSNEDPYAIALVKTSDYDGKTDAEIKELLLDGSITLFEVTDGGNWSQEMSGLEAGTSYTVYAFGYEYGIMTTDLFVKEFVTLAADDAYRFTATTVVEDISTMEADVTIIGEPNNVLYCFDIVPEGITEEEVKAELESRIEFSMEIGSYPDRLSYLNAAGTRGTFFYKPMLKPETDYVIWTLSIEENNGDFALFDFSGEFSTLAIPVSDIQLTVTCDKYFDVDELAEAYPGQYDYYKGNNLYCLPVMSETSEDVYKILSYVFTGDLTDENEYSDAELIADLDYDGKRGESVTFYREYGVEATLVVVAVDYFDNYTKVYRQLLNCTKEGASDVSEFPAM